MIESSIRKLSVEGLQLVIEDAQARIGSHVGMSEEPVPEYVAKQQGIIDMVRDELERRKGEKS